MVPVGWTTPHPCALHEKSWDNVVYYGVKETEKKEENDEIDNKSKVGEVGET